MRERLSKQVVIAHLALFLMVGGTASQPATAASSVQLLDFAVSLGERTIGSHRFEIQQISPDRMSIKSTASFDVRFLGVNAYRYRHSAEELWESGCVQELAASTDANGKQVQVEARRAQGSTRITKPGLSVLEGVCAFSYAYWDRALLKQSKLLNPQTGQLDAVRIEPRGTEQITVRGVPTRAERFRLVSDVHTIDLWYSPGGQWLQLDSATPWGMSLRYRLKG